MNDPQIPHHSDSVDSTPLTVLLMPWGRVGSNMANAALSGAGAKVFNETLTGIEARHPMRGQPGAATAIAEAQTAWLHEYLAAKRLTQPTILNHAALSTADPEQMRHWIDTRRPRLVTLDRKDDAAVALSSARAETWVAEGRKLGEARNWSVDRNVDFRPHIAPDDLRRRLGYVRQGRAIMHQLVAGLPVLRLFYEDLVSDMDGAMAALMRHSGIGWQEITIRTRRFSTDHLAQMVANPQEIAAVLRDDGQPTAITM